MMGNRLHERAGGQIRGKSSACVPKRVYTRACARVYACLFATTLMELRGKMGETSWRWFSLASGGLAFGVPSVGEGF